MDDSQKLDKVLEILERRDSVKIEHVTQVEAFCRVCGRREWQQFEGGRANVEDLAKILKFYADHGVEHSGYGGTSSMPLHNVEILVSFQK